MYAGNFAIPYDALDIGLRLIAATVAVVSLFQALNHSGETVWTLLLAFGSVIFGWLTIHTMTALHYAHLYYSRDEAAGKDQGGLDFPDTPTPDYFDFAYFSFTLGMTFQTSDTAINSGRVRRIVTLHSFAAFVFNIGVIAFTINALGAG